MSKFDVVKTLYEGQLSTIKTISERSFSATLQTVSLNVAIVAGLVGSKVILSPSGRKIGSILVIVFNGLVTLYLISKSRAHHREKKKLIEIQNILADLGEIDVIKQKKLTILHFWKSFFGGTFIFISSIIIATYCSISALRTQLIEPETPKVSNSSIQHETPQKVHQYLNRLPREHKVSNLHN